ncbi:hypothetical protein A4V12_30205 [Streptomyces noursei]|nr:hypothetical protein A4V12_30205 [Streptomyces noursei]
MVAAPTPTEAATSTTWPSSRTTRGAQHGDQLREALLAAVSGQVQDDCQLVAAEPAERSARPAQVARTVSPARQ